MILGYEQSLLFHKSSFFTVSAGIPFWSTFTSAVRIAVAVNLFVLNFLKTIIFAIGMFLQTMFNRKLTSFEYATDSLFATGVNLKYIFIGIYQSIPFLGNVYTWTEICPN